VIDAQSADWDALFLPLINRRVGLVYPRAKCPRVFAQIGGHNPTVVRDAPGAKYRKMPALLAAALSERVYRRIAEREMFFVNGEALLPYYDTPRNPVGVLRSSARRAEFRFVAPDRFQGDPQLLVVSRITAPKGVFDVLEAFGRLRASSMPTATLHMVGNGDAEGALRARAAELGVDDAIVWHGWVAPGAELYGIVQQMDVLLTLSYAESLPKTVWEAMAHSVLVVATPVGALPHVFTDGEDLLFVPPRDPVAAAAAVERLAGDPDLRHRLIARGLETSADVTVEGVAQQLLDRVVERWPELAAGNRARE
jgi:glycosyltransferase involved in cell wall biosynthesis